MADKERDFELEPDSKKENRIAAVGLAILELVRVAILAAITIGAIRYFLFKPFYVKGQSMEPNFEEHDYLIIDEISYRFHAPERGDVIVLRAPVAEKDYYLKRVIGLPGERVKVEGNNVVIYNENNPQGIVLKENYIRVKTAGSVSVTLGSDEYFVLGDNRDASFDSRRFGSVKRADIVGRTWLRGWPPSRFQTYGVTSYNL